MKRENSTFDRAGLSFICTLYISLLFGTFMLIEMDINHTWQAVSRIRAEVC